MKIIFLDVDGVLITERAYWQAQLNHLTTPLFDQRALLALRWLVEQTGARLVLTSSWRTRPNCSPSPSYLRLKSTLLYNRTPLYDQTPILTAPTLDRSDEVAAWLAEHAPEHYVILDDNDRFTHHPDIRSHWVCVSGRHGFTRADAERAARVLGA